MSGRNIGNVIDQLKVAIGQNNEQLLKELDNIRCSASYTPPEVMSVHWGDIGRILQTYIPRPVEDWHFKTLSIFSTISESDLRKAYV